MSEHEAALSAEEIRRLRRLMEGPQEAKPAGSAGPSAEEIALSQMTAERLAQARDQFSSGPSWLERSREACPDDVMRSIVADNRRRGQQ